MKKIFSNTMTEKGFSFLKVNGNVVECLSTEQINVGDLVTAGNKNSNPIYREVIQITETRPQAGHFTDESKRRNWLSLIVGTEIIPQYELRALTDTGEYEHGIVEYAPRVENAY